MTVKTARGLGRCCVKEKYLGNTVLKGWIDCNKTVTIVIQRQPPLTGLCVT